MARRHKSVEVETVTPEELQTTELQGSDFLVLRYVLLDDLLYLAGNPKLHDDPAIESSIVENGFRDPAAWDSSLNEGKGGLVEGNGRTGVLKRMQDAKRATPRGIGIYLATGQWAMPIIFGCDARSEEAALRYAIDHNNLTLGAGFSATETVKLWDEKGYLELLERLEESDNLPLTVSNDDLESILRQAASTADGGAGSAGEAAGTERADSELINPYGDESKTEKEIKPHGGDDDYSVFELVMLHKNKLYLLETLNKIKAQYLYDKLEDALVRILKEFNGDL